MKTKYQTKKRNFYYTTFGINYSEEKTEDFRRIIQTEHSCTAALSLNTHTEWKKKKKMLNVYIQNFSEAASG